MGEFQRLSVAPAGLGVSLLRSESRKYSKVSLVIRLLSLKILYSHWHCTVEVQDLARQQRVTGGLAAWSYSDRSAVRAVEVRGAVRARARLSMSKESETWTGLLVRSTDFIEEPFS